MSKFLWILGATTLGVAAYVLVKQPQTAPVDGVDSAAAKASLWGTKQRASGLGGGLKGKLEQGAGQLTDDPDMTDKGAFDETAGKVQNAVGKVAQAVGSTIHDLNK